MVKKLFTALLLFMIIGLMFWVLYLPNPFLKCTKSTDIQHDNNYNRKILSIITPDLKEIEYLIKKSNSLEIPNSTDLIMEYIPAFKSEIFISLLDLGGNIKRDYKIVDQIALFISIENFKEEDEK